MIDAKDFKRMKDLIITGKSGDDVAKKITDIDKALNRWIAANILLNRTPDFDHLKEAIAGDGSVIMIPGNSSFENFFIRYVELQSSQARLYLISSTQNTWDYLKSQYENDNMVLHYREEISKAFKNKFEATISGSTDISYISDPLRKGGANVKFEKNSLTVTKGDNYIIILFEIINNKFNIINVISNFDTLINKGLIGKKELRDSLTSDFRV